MFSPDDFLIRDTEHKKQYDFFETLDNSVPDEDYREYPLDKFGTMLCFNPKNPNTFEVSNPSAQITGTITFNQQGVITGLSLSRWHGEPGEIEKNWVQRFKEDAEKAITEHADVLQIEMKYN